ncbi:Serine/threonine protein kinase [Nonomuraea solani]|uniref:Serine/threonine protein kinase n=1 Tax=Nonomuraea solani TaxID=1144553 RepID=A0A1H6EZ58_9ACTN|nr:serine/threonine-protein kinase [Nonomuraea solani]SEH03188.1 Serine/threonine protein kinase [Nonomuraea solani]
MPEPEAPHSDDPAEIAGYTLIGRLGEGGQGTVHLATAADGTKVALKLLRADLVGDAEASQRFVREVALARRVAPFCTAQVLDTGLDGGRPYIVSEYVEGPTLAEVVRNEGPRTGASLHRLAISTVTALTAIHQAGVVHRDFKPSNVLLAADGPRVIDFGVAKALDLTSTLTAGVVGTPAFMAPEQFGDAVPGPSADMFAWAGTMLYAATGRYPFGQDSLPAVIGRILTAEPDAGRIEDPALRALVLDCLAKDPARRPGAGEALDRLLGMSPRATPRPVIGKRTMWIVAAAVTTALALTALALVLRAPATPRVTAASVSPSAKGTIAPSTRSFSVPSTTMRVYEAESDPIKMASYYGGNGVYVRQQGSMTFKRHKEFSHPYVPSPDGTRALALNNYSPDNGPKTVSIIDRPTGTKKVVTVSSERGVWAFAPRWSADGRYGLVTLSLPGASGDAWTKAGYAIVDIARATAREVEVEDAPGGLLRFFWVGDSVGMWAKDGTIRLYDLSGAYQRSLANGNPPEQMDNDPVSPDGTRFVARCALTGTDLCVHPVSGGGGAVTVPFTGERLVGWWDDDHLVVWRPKGDGYEIAVIDLSGERLRVLATTTDKTQGLFHFTRAAI